MTMVRRPNILALVVLALGVVAVTALANGNDGTPTESDAYRNHEERPVLSGLSTGS